MTTLPPDLKGRILLAAHAAPSPTRPVSRASTWLVAPASIIAAASLFFAFNGTAHGNGRASWFYAATTLGWAAVAGLSMWGALARGDSALGRPRAALLAIAVATPASLFAFMFGLAFTHPEVTTLHPERLGLKCFALTVAAAAFPLIALAVARRGSDPIHPVATGAALGAACGASSGVMVEMWCPVAAPAHVVLGHILPIVVLSLLGAVLGARFIAMRPKTGRRGAG
jgi:hypothetical protein